MDVLPGMTESDNVDWVHLAATIDTWGIRGTSWVTPEGQDMPPIVPINMIGVMHLTLDGEKAANSTDTESSEDSDQCNSEYESQAQTNSEPDPNMEARCSRPRTVTSLQLIRK